MLKDPPKKGDTRYKMYTTKGADWVAWQDVWLEGLQVLRNRQVFVVAASEEFENKFKKATDDEKRTRKTVLTRGTNYQMESVPTAFLTGNDGESLSARINKFENLLFFRGLQS